MRRNSQPLFEYLDSRKVLSTIHFNVVAKAAGSVAIAQHRSRHQTLLERRIERKQGVVERHELRRHGLETRRLAHLAIAAATSSSRLSNSAPQVFAIDNGGVSVVSAPIFNSIPCSGTGMVMAGSSGSTAHHRSPGRTPSHSA
jgi:hypothetical protein